MPIPRVIASALPMPIVQSAFYFAAKLIVARRPRHNKPGALDGRVPFVPLAAVPYLSSYLFWLLGYAVVYAADRAGYVRMLAAQIAGTGVCFAFFVAMPTEMTVPQPPEGFGGLGVRLIQRLDSPPVNLFPSMHCMASWLCVFGLAGAGLPAVWPAAGLLWTLAIVWSTVAVKQHYVRDTAAGLAVAAAAWMLVRAWPWPGWALAGLLDRLGL